MKLKFQIIDAESYRLQCYIYEDLLNHYKRAINEITEKNKPNVNDEILTLIAKENFILKSSYDTLTSSVNLLRISVRIIY
jgi:hypothetical protein